MVLLIELKFNQKTVEIPSTLKNNTPSHDDGLGEKTEETPLEKQYEQDSINDDTGGDE
jgi:hypothetical protein